MPFKTIANWLSNDILCYLVIGASDLKTDVPQQKIKRVYYILNLTFLIMQFFLHDQKVKTKL